MILQWKGKRPRTKHTGEFGVSVRKKYWGNRIGRLLVSYLINWAKESGVIRKINLRVRSDNKRGINLYTNLGFVKEGLVTRDMCYKGRFYDSLQMGLTID